MIPVDTLYGWGVCRVPLQRPPPARRARGKNTNWPGAELPWQLLREVPWKETGATLLLALCVLTGILLLDRLIPQAPPPASPPPVEIAVRLFAPEPAPLEAVAPPRQSAPVPPPAPPKIAARPAPQATPQLPARPVTSVPHVPQPHLALNRPTEPLAPPAASRAAPVPAPKATQLPPRLPALQRPKDTVSLAVTPPRPTALPRDAVATLPPSSAVRLRHAEPVELAGLGPALPRLAPRSDTVTAELPQRILAGGGVAPPDALPAAPVLPGPASRRAPTGKPVGAPKSLPLTAVATATPDLGGPAKQAPPSAPAPPRAATTAANFAFLDRLRPEELDPQVLVPFNQLLTCLDPREEQILRTRLAALLDGPTLCRRGGVVFAIRHPESAYSVHLAIYNYEGLDLGDRCAALRVAIESCTARR